METIVNKMTLLNETESSFLLSILVADLVKEGQFDIIEKMGGKETVIKLIDKIENDISYSELSVDEQADIVANVAKKLMFNLDLI
jgi:hypothetical protein